jgi:CBS domain-containing protein
MGWLDDDILRATMTGLESGLRVLHIAATPLQVRESSDSAAEVLRDSSLKDYDRIPVTENGRIVGVLERSPSVLDGCCGKHMRRLDESILISAEEPLTKLLPLLQHSPYRLVLRGPEIRGIVTRSDIAKLPVRVLAFALLTHLEMVMAEVIRAQCPSEEQWRLLLSAGRRQKLDEKQGKSGEENLSLPLLELTDFCDKRTIVKKLLKLSDEFEESLVDIEKLRNTLAHAGDYAQDAGGLRNFLDRLRLTQRCIDELSAHLTPG